MTIKFFKAFFILLLLLFSLFSFSGKMYYFIQPYLGVPLAYVIDQGIFLLIAFFFILLLLVDVKIREKVKKLTKQHSFYILFLCFVSFITHGLVINYYFFAEDVSSILLPANNEYILFPFSTMNNGYPLLPFIFSFLIFKSSALGYNILSLSLYILCVISLYWFCYLVSRRKPLSLLAGLFFATTPSYIDMFSWQASVQGMSLVLALGLYSFIFLIYYQKFNSFLYFVISFVFFAAAIKIGFVRSAGLIIPLIFLLLFPIYNFGKLIWSKTLHGIPYMLLWTGFIFSRFGIKLFLSPFVRSDTSLTIPYLPTLSYYVTHLFLPAEIARYFIPVLRDIPFYLAGSEHKMPSIVFIIGLCIIVVLLFTGFIALFIKDIVTKWILIFSLLVIFGGLFYVPFFGTVPPVDWFDIAFLRFVPPYGPGSRYVFFSAIGVSIFFATVIYLLASLKKPILRKFSFVLAVLVISVNCLLSIQAHKQIVKKISNPDKIFIDKFFSLVPIDGRKKIVIALNPKTNAIDNNVGGKNWLYGFYKQNELIYSKDLNEAKKIVESENYNPGNIYAFYHNPDTLSFKDTTKDIISVLFSKTSEKFQTGIPFRKKQNKAKFSTVDTQWGKRNIISRGILESDDLDIRILEEKYIHIIMNIVKSSNGNFPYSDIFLTSSNNVLKSIWTIIPSSNPIAYKDIQNIPPSFTLSSFDYQGLQEIPITIKRQILAILENRERLRNNTRVTVSNIHSEDKRINEKSLVDGLYTGEPRPADNETFYLSNELPVTLIFELPFPITLGRISMNTSRSFSEHYPTDLDVFASYDGAIYQQVESIKNNVGQLRSPNNGKLFTFFPENIPAKFIKIVIKKTINNQSVMFDEITIDDISAVKYTDEQVYEYRNKTFLYVDNQELLNQIMKIGVYNYIPIIYSCAEENDWKMQKNDYSKLLPGVWKVELFQPNNDVTEQNISIPISCYGSTLRKIILIGPPFSTEMNIKRAYLE